MTKRLGIVVAMGIVLCRLQGWGLAEPVREQRDAASQQAIERDWMLQDFMSIQLPPELERQKRVWRDTYIPSEESKPDAPVFENIPCFVSRRDCVVAKRMVERVLEELGASGAALRKEVRELSESGVAGSHGRWKALYRRACGMRRSERLKPLLARWKQFVFVQHHRVPRTWKYTEALSCALRKRFFASGASLNILELDGACGKLRTLIDDPNGMLRNPDVSFDGNRILFAWKHSDRQDDYHLYEMDVATQRVRQLTFGLGVADYEGIYLPDGNIMFSSTRCIQTVDCNWTEVSNLYLMDGEGRYMRRIGFDQVHTIFPTATDDGRVLYTRWDYNDRAQIFPQPLFQMNIDGTNQREFYGGTSWFPTNIVHARQIPGTGKVVAIVTGHHRPAHGKLAILDPAKGRQEEGGVTLIAPVRKPKPLRIDKYGIGGNQFQYPYPVDGTRFLVTLALPGPTGDVGRFNIYLIDVDARRELLVEGQETGDGIGCRQVVPLAPRPRGRVRASVVDYREKTGTIYVQDIHAGAGLKGVPQGTVKSLRVVALKYRATGIGMTKQSGPLTQSNVSTPIAIGNGSWDVKEVLGTAKVYQDGSVCFTAPARSPLYFQALDDRNHVVQTMRSWVTLMPGERLSCVGCHTSKKDSPFLNRETSLAAQAGPQPLAPFHGPPRTFSFAKEIQPILDRHCVECHCEGQDAPDLTGTLVILKTMRRRLSRSYLALTHTQGSNGNFRHPVVNWINSMSGPAMLPAYYRGAATSRLISMLEQGHQGVTLSRDELDRFACWIDLLVPYCGDYREANAWSESDRRLYDHYAAKRERYEAEERENIEALIRNAETSQPAPSPATDWHDIAWFLTQRAVAGS